ncbi:hypothetical protein D3C86_1594240 [compost metagenome]
MTKCWIEQTNHYLWKVADGPWNKVSVTLYCRYLLPERFFTEETAKLHPNAEFTYVSGYCCDRKPDFRPPSDLVRDYDPTGLPSYIDTPHDAL